MEKVVILIFERKKLEEPSKYPVNILIVDRSKPIPLPYTVECFIYLIVDIRAEVESVSDAGNENKYEELVPSFNKAYTISLESTITA